MKIQWRVVPFLAVMSGLNCGDYQVPSAQSSRQSVKFLKAVAVSFKIDVASTVIMRQPPVEGPHCLLDSGTQAPPAASFG